MTDFDQYLSELAKKMADLPKKIDNYVVKEINENNNVLEDLNISQLQKGEYSTGGKIKPEYTKRTKAIKTAKGQPIDRVTLKDEGDFYKSIEYKADLKGVEYKASDVKTDNLEEKYGEEILGLSDTSINEVVEFLEIDLITEIQKNLGI